MLKRRVFFALRASELFLSQILENAYKEVEKVEEKSRASKKVQNVILLKMSLLLIKFFDFEDPAQVDPFSLGKKLELLSPPLQGESLWKKIKGLPFFFQEDKGTGNTDESNLFPFEDNSIGEVENKNTLTRRLFPRLFKGSPDNGEDLPGEVPPDNEEHMQASAILNGQEAPIPREDIAGTIMSQGSEEIDPTANMPSVAQSPLESNQLKTIPPVLAVLFIACTNKFSLQF